MQYKRTVLPNGLRLITISMPSLESATVLVMVRFEEVVIEAGLRYSPNTLCTYLFELAQAFNLFYQKYPILKAEEEQKNFRLGLTKATGETLKEGLKLLGIQAPERM